MKIKSLATMLIMGMCFTSTAYVAPALAADDDPTQIVASDSADDYNLQNQDNDASKTSPSSPSSPSSSSSSSSSSSNLSQNNPATPGNLTDGSDMNMDQATPDTVAGDDDY